MVKVKFVVPSITSKQVSPNSLKIYKSRLNKLADSGFKTIEDLMEKPQDVLQSIYDLVGGEDPSPEHQPHSRCLCIQCKTREQIRNYLNAIFYVLADTDYIKTHNPYYQVYQLNKQNYNSH